MDDQLTVLYDADCGICTHTARLLTRLDSRHKLRLVALQAAALPGMPAHDSLEEALHAVDAHGRWTLGVDAAVQIARRVPLLWPLGAVARLPLATPILGMLYTIVARNRQRLSRLLGLQVCRVPRRET